MGPAVPGARAAWISVAAALATIALKSGAYLLTGSVGLLADALESVVNLVAAGVLVVALRIAAAPPDAKHEFGHGKAEYFSSGLEGALIFVAAVVIVISAVPRLLAPVPLQRVDLGLVVSAIAAIVNLLVARHLLAASRRHASIALEADAHHLMTDVWTSVGVIAGVALVEITAIPRIDPLVALGVSLHILWMGVRLIRRSVGGLMDAAVAPEDRLKLVRALDQIAEHESIGWHALRTRQSGQRRFVNLHVLVPGQWSVARGHAVCERIEQTLAALHHPTTVLTHLEPNDEHRALADLGLDHLPGPNPAESPNNGPDGGVLRS